MSAAFTLWQKHMAKFWRHGEEVVGTLLSPILWVLLFGAGMGAVTANSATGIEDYTKRTLEKVARQHREVNGHRNEGVVVSGGIAV